jgi:hypothetical protein
VSSHLEDDFDLSVVVETWASIGGIPRHWHEALVHEHERNIREPAGSPPIAPANYCTELDLPEGSTWPEVVASVLDALTGRPTCEHLREVQIALDLGEEAER